MPSILKNGIRRGSSPEAKRNYTVTLPGDLHNYLVLFCYANGRTKVKVSQEVLEKWKTSVERQQPVDQLLQRIGERALQSWKFRKAKKPDLQLRAFKAQLIYELEWKGLDVPQIETILIVFNNGTR